MLLDRVWVRLKRVSFYCRRFSSEQTCCLYCNLVDVNFLGGGVNHYRTVECLTLLTEFTIESRNPLNYLISIVSEMDLLDYWIHKGFRQGLFYRLMMSRVKGKNSI